MRVYHEDRTLTRDDSGSLWPTTYALWNQPIAPARGDMPASGDWICGDLRIFHDAERPVLAWDQRGRPGQRSLGLCVYQFDGGYLSLAVGMSAEHSATLEPGLTVTLDLAGRTSRPLNAFLRLNLETESGAETLHDAFIFDAGHYRFAFDLAAGLPAGIPPETTWIDLIFSAPAMCEIEISALTLDLTGGAA